MYRKQNLALRSLSMAIPNLILKKLEIIRNYGYQNLFLEYKVESNGFVKSGVVKGDNLVNTIEKLWIFQNFEDFKNFIQESTIRIKRVINR